MCTVLLALDISAAFDAVKYHILCKCLESDFGVTGVALGWLTSFVSDRSQYVAIGSERLIKPVGVRVAGSTVTFADAVSC